MNKETILKVLWITLVVSSLSLLLVGKDGDIILMYVMLVLSFPSSFIVNFVFGGLCLLLASFDINPLGHSQVFLWWILVAGLGYFQWFTLFPKIYRKWKDWR